MERLLERGFVGLAAVLLVLAVGTAVAVPRPDAPSGGVAFDAGVPEEYEFTPPTEPGTATVDGETFDSLAAALSAAEPGDTVTLSGRFEGDVVVNTTDLTITSAPGELALLNGTGTGDVLTLNGANATVRRVWVRNSGYDAAENDAGIWVNASRARLEDVRVTDVTFGIWIDGVDDAYVGNATVVGREEVRPLSYRGNGIELWKTDGTLVEDSRITDVRDGIYYSWASDVLGRNNTMWDLRYGVHYMYSDNCQLVNNTAFDNDAGYALMVSRELAIVDNVAVNNTGTSGHGILVKSIDATAITGNDVVGNEQGLYVYNSLDNTIAGNLVLDNDVGVQLTAGSVEERVYDNSFIDNDRAVLAVTSEQVAWNESGRGNYWAGARVADLDRDGVSELRHQPAGIVERLLARNPQARVFAASPAFDAIRLAESSFPVVESPGVVDHHPLVDPPHADWRRYYAGSTRTDRATLSLNPWTR